MSPEINECTKPKRTRSRNRKRDNNKPSPNKVECKTNFKTQGMLFGDLDPVPFDYSIDPKSHACFNCWSFEHIRKVCPEPKTHNYCCNCGRMNLTILECPRCSRPFYELRDDLKNWIHRNFLMETTLTNGVRRDENWNNCNNKDNCQSPGSSAAECYKSAPARKKLSFYKDEGSEWQPPTYVDTNDLFNYMRASKGKDELLSENINNLVVNLDETRMAERNSLGENSVISDDDFQKEEKKSNLNNEPLQDFLNLLSALKHLPIDTQNVVVLQFMSERKNQMLKNEMESVRKPEL